MKLLSDHPFALHQPFSPAQNKHGDKLFLKPSLVFCFYNDKLLLDENDAIPSFPISLIDASIITYSRLMGFFNSMPCYVIEIKELPKNLNHLTPRGKREVNRPVADDLFIITGKAYQIYSWHIENRFCGKCGSPMKEKETELAKVCPDCSFIVYPTISPVVIMSIEKDDNILLGRSPHFRPGVYSPLAGFVEVGETLEEAVQREILEEVGIEVTNIQYITSQPWPFPHSLMTGFRTTYLKGEIQIAEDELEDAKWFNIKDLPKLPSKLSISRYLVDLFLRDHHS